MKFRLLMVLAVMLMAFGSVQAADSVSIALYNVTDGVYVNEGENIFATDIGGTPIQYRFELSVENDFVLGGMSLGFSFNSDDANINWEPQVGGWDSTGANGGFVTIPDGARFNPTQGTGSFDMTGLYITQVSTDSIPPDSVMFGGVALFNGIAIGPMEHIISAHFTIDYTGTAPTNIVIDSTRVGPVGDFTYVTLGGSNVTPEFGGGVSAVVWQDPSMSADDNVPAIAYSYALEQNVPNPFNPATKISYSLAKKSDVNIAVFNILGQKVNTLVNGSIDAGIHEVIWNGDDEQGNTVASGIYFYKIVTNDFVDTKKMVLMR